jgi:hypothetical protein
MVAEGDASVHGEGQRRLAMLGSRAMASKLPLLAYRAAFATLAIGLVLGASVYVRSRDSATALLA